MANPLQQMLRLQEKLGSLAATEKSLDMNEIRDVVTRMKLLMVAGEVINGQHEMWKVGRALRDLEVLIPGLRKGPMRTEPGTITERADDDELLEKLHELGSQ